LVGIVSGTDYTKPIVVALPDNTLVANTTEGTISSAEVKALRHVAHLASMVGDFSELQYAVNRAIRIRQNDKVILTTAVNL
jgi:hypothetical protein